MTSTPPARLDLHEVAVNLGSIIAKHYIDQAAEGGAHHWDLMPEVRTMIETLGSKDRPWTEAALESARDAFMEYEREADYQDQCMWATRLANHMNARPEADNPGRLIARTDFDHGRRVVRLGDDVWTIHIEKAGRVYAKCEGRMLNISDLTLGGGGTVVEMLP